MANISMSNKNGKTITTVTTNYSRDGDNYSITTTAKQSSPVGLKVFALLCGVLLLAGLLSLLLQKGQTITFGSLLQYMSEAPSVSHVFSHFETISQLTGDFGFLDIFVIPINAGITILNTLIFFFKLIANSLDFVLYFITFFF